MECSGYFACLEANNQESCELVAKKVDVWVHDVAHFVIAHVLFGKVAVSCLFGICLVFFKMNLFPADRTVARFVARFNGPPI